MSINEQFHVEKVFKNCTDPFELGNNLKNEKVIISLIQDFKPLAEVAVSLKDFLYNSSHKQGSNLVREILVHKNGRFPGLLSPKLEFISQTSIREVIAKPKKSSLHKLYLARPKSPDRLEDIKSYKHIEKKSSPKVKENYVNLVNNTEKPPWNSPIKSKKQGFGRSLSQPSFSRSPRKKIPIDFASGTNKKKSISCQKIVAVDDTDLPNYMRPTTASRSKSPTRLLQSSSQNLRCSSSNNLNSKQNAVNKLTKQVKIATIPTNLSEYHSKCPASQSFNKLEEYETFHSLKDNKTGLLKPNNVERLLESKQAREIYNKALQDAAITDRLNNLRVDFNPNGDYYWSKNNAFMTGKSHRQTFNSLLDEAYNSFYDTLKGIKTTE